MKMTFATTGAGLCAGLLLSSALWGAPNASTAPPRSPPEATFASALAQVSAGAKRVQANSRQIELAHATANTHLQNGATALKSLTDGSARVTYRAIYATRGEFQNALGAFERISDLLDDNYATLGAMPAAIETARQRVSTVLAAQAQLAQAEQMAADALRTGQEATRTAYGEIAPGTRTAKAHLAELDTLEKEQQSANGKNSRCDIHRQNWPFFKYPASIRIWYPDIRNPSYDPRPAGSYTLYSTEYADLNGNGRVEAIVQLRQEYFMLGLDQCRSGGQSQTFVYEMDANCVLQRLAQIQGKACDRTRIQGQTLLVDQPLPTSYVPASDGTPVCNQPWVRRFAWQFKAGKLVSTFRDSCKQSAAN